MDKTSVEVRRVKDLPLSYGVMNPPREDGGDVLDVLIEWSKRPENVNRKVYRHVLRSVYENVSGEADMSGFTVPFPPGHGIKNSDLVFYVDIYHQEV